ncbi:PPK2 family polyphosphate kinase [Nonlabens marinus]|uniref:Bll6474 protein n=1 Tax=Nonlabens marinus S1-08 TaxID=1454201 RepID=W8VVM8_9FLAO|nr:phosphate--nucleotide phosphotransferase [Nonlabens marinus]BAO54012.1 bll6474 protein [Nonlabens marinus S1-08]
MNLENYRATADKKLESYSTKLEQTLEKKAAKKALKKSRRTLAEFQERLYADDKYAVLVCFQGMDTSGKDSLIREVFKDFNVRGVEQHSFKVPTELELSYGYLWRHYIALPRKGAFGIFNRTHYENVLVTRVHPEYLMNENLPGIDSVDDVDQDFWNMRYEQINNFEKELTQNGTIIFKFFLNLSKEEQKNRLLRRLNLPEKNWKFSAGDLAERELWDKYMNAYEQAIQNTSTENAPWYVIPADDKPIARYMVSEILVNHLEPRKDIQFPTLDEKTAGRLEEFKNKLSHE